MTKDDIDALSLLSVLKKFILALLKGSKDLVVYSWNHKVTLLVFALIGTAVSFAVYFSHPPFYKSGMTVAHIRVDNEYCKQMIANLDAELDGGENTVFANDLKISSNISKQVRSLSYKSINDNLTKRYTDSLEVLLPFRVEIEVYEPQVLDSLGKAIIGYLESNPYAQQLKAIDKQAIIETESMLNSELKQIDSLKKIVSASIMPRGTGSGLVYGEPVDPINIYKSSIELFDKKMKNIRKNKLSESFISVVGFNKMAFQSSFGKKIHLVLGLFFGYLFGLIFLGYKELK